MFCDNFYFQDATTQEWKDVRLWSNSWQIRLFAMARQRTNLSKYKKEFHRAPLFEKNDSDKPFKLSVICENGIGKAS